MKKLNKSKQWELIQQVVATTATELEETFKKDKASVFTESLLSELAKTFKPSTGGTNSNKINEEGQVYCNYFEAYFEPSEFNTKINRKTGKEGYKANCKEAEVIIRKVRQLKQNCTNIITSNFMLKIIDVNEMSELLDKVEKMALVKYIDIKDIPTSVELLGLKDKMSEEVEAAN